MIILQYNYQIRLQFYYQKYSETLMLMQMRLFVIIKCYKTNVIMILINNLDVYKRVKLK
mgnify:CR=1 FL=1